MTLVIVAAVSFTASLLTFFSGFGLGTVLLPVFSLMMPVPTAVMSTAIVHFSNNLFKLALLLRRVSWKFVLYFGSMALPFAVAGAFCLKLFADLPPLGSYFLLGHELFLTPVSLTVGFLMIFFAIFEWLPYFRSKSLSSRWIFAGGALSGFFGGLSGHQGALRSIFLLRLNLDKEAFLATGVAIATLIDVARLATYSTFLSLSFHEGAGEVISVAIGAAIAGALIGKYLLGSLQIAWIRAIVCLALIGIGSLVMIGIL